ncbi:uncharacterized protein LOC110450518 isoform X3 [Mizuhopecten yessoensis]|uniref:uncharacterized protein LOC110450518 isoform X3 n=1 Tax=Mizuhopecten yessoensis TaxID=6573 RepID=UPI000B458FA7|nr:uncharacterized protein LOC110450518 isoform X3 [Mizuhopecten yessoensis]
MSTADLRNNSKLHLMTFWSRHDPIKQQKGHTDHWSKARQKTGAYTVSYGAKGLQIRSDTDLDLATVRKAQSTRVRFENDCVTRMPMRSIDDMILHGLDAELPTQAINQRPRMDFSRKSSRTTFNERARDGFRYWLIDRPKPTKFGRYGIGSYKTVLGIGNAPRTSRIPISLASV